MPKDDSKAILEAYEKSNTYDSVLSKIRQIFTTHGWNVERNENNVVTVNHKLPTDTGGDGYWCVEFYIWEKCNRVQFYAWYDYGAYVDSTFEVELGKIHGNTTENEISYPLDFYDWNEVYAEIDDFLSSITPDEPPTRYD